MYARTLLDHAFLIYLFVWEIAYNSLQNKFSGTIITAIYQKSYVLEIMFQKFSKTYSERFWKKMK